MPGEKKRAVALGKLTAQFKAQIASVEHGSTDFFKVLEEMAVKSRSIIAKVAGEYPLDIPNAACRHAVLIGIAIDNQAWKKSTRVGFPAKGDRLPFFVFGSEAAFLWTHSEDEYTLLLVETDPSKVQPIIWRTLGNSMSIAASLTSMFESLPDVGYAWIFKFAEALTFSEQDLLDNDDRFALGTRTINRIEDWFDRAPILELLQRDEKFFVASQMLCEAFRNHSFCLTCALRPVERRQHGHREPDSWNMLAHIPSMEAAIVQATRAVEGLLGKPGKDRIRTTNRWIKQIDLAPDASFELVGKTYLDYYYELFGTRNSAAHSFGKISADLTRAKAVAAQTFAHLVIFSHFERNACSIEEALERLSFNSELLENINKGQYSGVSTPKTAKKGRALPWSS